MITRSVFQNNEFFSKCCDSAISANWIRNSVFIGNAYEGTLLSVDEMINSRFERNTYLGDEVGYTISNGSFRSVGTGVVNNQFKDSGTVFVSTTNPVSNNLFSNTRLAATDENGLPKSVSRATFLSTTKRLTLYNCVRVNLNNNYIDTDRIRDIQLSGSGNLSSNTALGFANAEEGIPLTSSCGLIDAGTTDPELAYITDYDYTGTTARVIGASVDIGR